MNRLVAYSDADIVVLAQDDDLPPLPPAKGSTGGGNGGGGEGEGDDDARGRWLMEVRALFCWHPRLGLISGKRGFKPTAAPSGS
mmetsp:Transcript_19440/g.48597  ORF Transcript_19440/g.48597 Transcript_19440/m.48597 type:complete len:84 (-) Transcript_19440:2527-2778(-)